MYLFGDTRGVQGEDQLSVLALDGAGHMKSGWPFQAPPGSAFGSLAVGLDGSVYVIECRGPADVCLLHRLGADGVELPGWPFELPASSACPATAPCAMSLIVGEDHTAYLTAWHQANDQTRIIAIDAAGEVKPGWPVARPDRYGWFTRPYLGSDGTLFISTRPDGSESPSSLAAYGPDGGLRLGWPVSAPGDYILGPDGTVVVTWGVDDEGELCTDFRRTVFTVLGPDGRTLPGWPRGSKGSASGAVVGADGTVYYVSALGNVYAHDRTGDVKARWPVSVPGVFPGCGAYGPFLSPDGTIVVLGDEVVAISPDGDAWRYRPEGALGGQSCDTDGSNRPGPALGADGTVYVSMFHSTDAGETVDIVALDRQGRVKPGWPYRLPIDGRTTDVGSLDVSPDGRLYVATGTCGPDAVATLLALDPDGRISE